MHGPSPVIIGLFNILPVLLGILYVTAATRDAAWSRLRTISFLGGLSLIIAAMSPSFLHWAHHDLRGHMIQHLMLGMFAPLCLVLAAPGTLLLRQVPVAAGRAIVAFLGTPPMRVLTHPVTAAVLDIGGMYVLYLTPLYAYAAGDPALHVLLHIHFVLAGYLFTWSIAGPDPAPHRPSMNLRLAVLLLATAAHGVLGKIMYGHAHPRDVTSDLEELRSAALWMYYGGDLAEVLLACAFFAMWFRRSGSRERVAA